MELPLHAFKYNARQLYCPQPFHLDGYGQMPNQAVKPYANQMHRIPGEKPRRDRMAQTMTFFKKASRNDRNRIQIDGKTPIPTSHERLVVNKWNKEYAKSVGRQRNTNNQTADLVEKSP